MRRARPDTWVADLDAFVRERMRMPFAWGSNDCCTFAHAAARLITGGAVEIAIPDYTDELGARRSIRALAGDGASDVRAVADAVLGEASRIVPALAQRGDLVFMEGRAFGSLGVCFGIHSWFVAEDGLIAVPTMDRVACAWQV